MTEDEIAAMDSEITAIVDDAVDWADKSPYPDPEDCLKNVYYEG
jgi:TPP-dependent pyruvate/acetoin dehydrogenase alpha subunit